MPNLTVHYVTSQAQKKVIMKYTLRPKNTSIVSMEIKWKMRK